jgi:DNA invertase Pin-like site-specific DNA recombinase
MRKFGYARVSTGQQSLDRQTSILKKEGIKHNRIFTDKISGTVAERQGMNLLKVKVEEGDIIYISSIDRLGRDNFEMTKLIKDFTSMGVFIHFIHENLATNSTHGELIIDIMLAVAKADRKRILENTQEGRLEAKARGVKFGRKRKIDRSKVIKMKKDRYGATEIAKNTGISRAMVYQILDEEKSKTLKHS